jgi:hypothetical protein
MPKRSDLPAGITSTLLAAALGVLTAAGAAADDVGGGTVRIEPQAEAEQEPSRETVGFQASLWPPVQIFDSAKTVRGVRLSFPYGRQARVSGLDFGLASHVTTAFQGVQLGLGAGSDGTASGLQLGFLTAARRGLTGVQLGFLNLADDGPVRGLQLGFANTAEGLTGAQLGLVSMNSGDATGAQLGLINTSGAHTGLQVGLVNTADGLRGLQLGLINLNRSGKPLLFLPVLNVGW